MRLPISAIAVAVLATMVSATHMRAEEIALRSGLFSLFDDFASAVFKVADPPPLPLPAPKADILPTVHVDIPQTIKFDTPPTMKMDPPGKFDPPSAATIDPPGKLDSPPVRGIDPPSDAKIDPSGKLDSPPVRGIDPPSDAKIDPSGKLDSTPVKGIDPPPEVPRPSNIPVDFPSSIDGLSSEQLQMLHAPNNRAFLEQEFQKLSKADQDLFNTKSMEGKFPAVVVPPKNIPLGKSIVDYSDLEMKTTYLDNPAYFLSEFKKLPVADQAKFNGKLKKLNLGDPLIPMSPSAAENIVDLKSTDLSTLYKNDRAYFEQEVNALPDAMKEKIYAKVRPLDELDPPDMPRPFKEIARPKDVPPTITDLKSDELNILYKEENRDYFFQEFRKLLKEDQDAFNVNAMENGFPQVILHPKNYPGGTPIDELSDAELKSMFPLNPAFFLEKVKKLLSSGQVKFNEKIQKLKLGNPLIPKIPSVKDAIHKLKPSELKKLFKSNRAYFDQEANALPDELKKKVYESARSLV